MTLKINTHKPTDLNKTEIVIFNKYQVRLAIFKKKEVKMRVYR